MAFKLILLFILYELYCIKVNPIERAIDAELNKNR